MKKKYQLDSDFADNKLRRITKETGEELSDCDSKFLERLYDKEDHLDGTIPVDFPLVDLPPGLHEKLYAIPDTKKVTRKKGALMQFFAAVAAMLIAGLFTFNQYSKQPSDGEVIRAQQELAIAFSYLNMASKKTNTTIRQTVSTNLQRVSVVSLIDTVKPQNESKEDML